DGLGFLRALQDEGGFVPEGSRVLILGAGGVARGVVLALSRAKVATLIIANRTMERAERLVALAQSADTEGIAISLDGGNLTEAAGTADLIVNCTTIGMSHGPDEGGLPLPAASITSTVLVNDLVYNPLETPLLKAAAQAGATCLGGILMLVYQGAASFEMWTGRDAPVAVMLDSATKAMASR
ncbi:MAG: saccharopine dehydrogenase NADP-binding domain-containing protein, partial [Chloroflexota bacterium]|nr:saccharopine dehydrogenase NADP-binding domain-containing protein [Chloroflexota bacterium]